MKYKQKIHNLIPIGFGQYYSFVPEEYDSELINELISVFAKKYLQLKSIDYTKKNYIDSLPNEIKEQNSQKPHQILLKKITDTVYLHAENLQKLLSEIDFTNETISSLAISTALGRLINSYECALFLIKNQFFFESISIIRMIFEQLAYCLNLSEISDNEFIKLSKNRIKSELSSTNINKLRCLITDKEIGKMYSYLSELTHIDYKHVNKYISYENDIKKVMITLKNINQSIESALLLLHIVDIHSIVFEYSLKRYIKNGFNCIIENEQKIEINKNRPMKAIIERFNQEFLKIKEEIKLPVHYM